MRTFIISSLFFFISPLIFCQEVEVYKDSIATEIRLMVSDSLRAQRFYKESTYALQRLNDLKLSRTYLDSSMYYSKISGFKDSEAKCHFLYGLLERISGNYEIALDHLDKNIKYFENDSTNRSYALFQIGSIKRNQGDYEGSLETFLEIMRIFEHKKDSSAMASTFTSLANIYGDMGNNKDAIINYEKAVEIFVKLEDKRSEANTIRNIAEIYLREEDTVRSRLYADRSLKLANELNEEYAKGYAHYMIARTYLNQDDQKVLDNYLKARSYLEKINYKKILIALYNDLGDFYRFKGDRQQSVYYYNKTLEILEGTEDLIQAKMTYKGLMENYASLSEYKKAFDYQNLYIQAKDSLFNEENIRSINLLQKQFETEKKDKEIAEQQLILNEQELELQERNTQIVYMSGITIFLVVASFLTWLFFKQKQRRKNQEILSLKQEQQIRSLEALINGEEKERSRIAKELHDGVNGDLSAIKHRLSKYQDQTGVDLSEAINMVDDSCDEVRAISHNLTPPSLENYTLRESLSEYCLNLNETRKEQITFQYVGDNFQCSKTSEVTIFRIVQELLNNSLKHAKAKEILVQLSSFEDTLQLTVEDDGAGFDMNQHKSQGLGLGNIRSRVEYLNGELDIQSGKDGSHFNITFNKNQLDVS